MAIRTERVTAAMEGDFAVFLIGMRANQWWRIDKWLPVVFAMARMLRELDTHPELGFLGAEQWFGRTTVMVSYWRSAEHLLDYAKARTAAHLPAWRAFNRAVGTRGYVGIWHETYRVRAGDHESVYVNMPPFGLGAVGDLVPATGAREGARGRLASATGTAQSPAVRP